MQEYTEGSLVRITATFSVTVDENVYFEFDDEDPIQYGESPDDYDGMIIVRDPSNIKKCWVDIDTLGIIGIHTCHFYMRGDYKAGEKRKFKVI